MLIVLKVFKKVFQLLVGLVYVVILMFLLIASPMIFGYRPVVVLSGSMEPNFPVGSIIYYRNADFQSIEVGDAITFKAADETLVTHRVTVKNEISRSFVTKGDANNTPDPNPVEYQRVVGKVWNIIIPFSGYFVMYGQKLGVILTMVAIIIVNVLLDKLTRNESMTRGEPD